ncbi:hypothetical protein BGZ99_000467 [Dissophora globulifera]|uniref:Zf-CHY-domain-containing protein n=1 Tax=Dissophora globulifera TaxID=979702 RepID=A0A9P6R226_9FUNG|nr:hypothetical protein BGZ99_000467 [Dissophora globulifera]
MSRPPSIYSDALETPHQDTLDDVQVSSSLSGRLFAAADHSSANDVTDMDVDVDEHPSHGNGNGDDDLTRRSDHMSPSSSSTFPATSTVVGGVRLYQPPPLPSSSQLNQSISSTTGGPGGQGGGSSSSASASGSGAGSGSAGASAGKPVSVPLVDEKAQSELRRKIMDIQRDPTISFADKAGMIQNEEQGQLGCKHYMRGCKLKANCCGKWFNCRFCHDDASDHAIVRSETKVMLCMHCQTTQPAAQNCSSCKACLAHYYCDVCKLWDDDAKKSIYHCDDCGICRIGQGLGRDYFHCKKCNVCMNIQLQGNHKCIERNLECDCPICGEYMFTSTTTVIFMPCGHCIHSRCHEDYIKTSYQCPTCWKSLGDMSGYYSKIDSLLAEQTMPPEYANIFSIVLCNDCEVKSEAPYHFLYHKCDKCKGYNTKVLETFKRVMDGQVQVVENATAAGATAAAPENNISGSSNGLAGPALSSAAAGAAGSSSSSSGAAGTVGTMPVNLATVSVPRSPLMDENASGDMTMAGISSNLAP